MYTKLTYILKPSHIQEIIHHINSGEILYNNLPIKQKHNNHIVIAAVKKDINNIKLIPARFYDDYFVMLELVNHNGLLLDYASEELIQDHNIVLTAVRQNGMALKIVYDYETIYEEEYTCTDGYDIYGPCIVRESRNIIDESYQNLVDDDEIVLTALAHDANAFDFISSRLQQKIDFLMIE